MQTAETPVSAFSFPSRWRGMLASGRRALACADRRSSFFLRRALSAAAAGASLPLPFRPMKEITSRSNPQLKLAAKLRRRRFREARGLCLLEGMRLVQDALKAGAAFHSCFITAEFARVRPDFAAQLEAVSQLYLAPAQLLDTISETVSSQSIVAIASIPDKAAPSASTLTLVLDGLQDPGNAGTLLRSAAAAGVDRVLFGPHSVDPYNAKVIRAAMGAHFRLPIQILDDWRTLSAALAPSAQLYVARADGGRRYDAVDWRAPSVLVLGSEARGAGSRFRDRAASVTIPMAAATESLNVAAAGAVILFEAAKRRRNAL